MDLSAVGANHLEGDAVDQHRFAALGHAAEAGEHQPAHGVVVLVREGRVEMGVEVGDFGHRLHTEAPVAVGEDVVLSLVKVELILDIADDLLDVEADAATLGKATGKDAEAGKATLVQLLGIEGARAEIARLTSEALQALQSWGAAADLLRAGLYFAGNRSS